jgi:hypothetical protein
MFNDMLYYDNIKLINEERIKEDKGIREYLKLEFRWIKRSK